MISRSYGSSMGMGDPFLASLILSLFDFWDGETVSTDGVIGSYKIIVGKERERTFGMCFERRHDY